MSGNYSLEYIDTQDKIQISIIEKIYTYSFPENERRDFQLLLELLDNNQYFNIVVVKSAGNTIGFITYWEFSKYIYIEHFAIDTPFRGKNAGSFAITKLHNIIPLPMILEVEPPVDEISRRRILFYQKLNFYLWADLHYIQPPYREGGESVELKLMTLGNLNLNVFYNDVVQNIYKNVYNVR